MVMKPLSEAQILAQEKEKLFLDDIEERKSEQSQLITQLNNQIEYHQAQIVGLELAKKKAQDLYDELEVRYPTKETTE